MEELKKIENNKNAKIMVCVAVCLVIVAVVVYKSREKFTYSERGGVIPVDLSSNPENRPRYYGAVPSNPTSLASNKTWAEYEQLKNIPENDVPFYAVSPDMMHLPPLRDIYNTPVRAQKLDPVSGIPVSMYTSPRVPLTDFKSETTRDYSIYQ